MNAPLSMDVCSSWQLPANVSTYEPSLENSILKMEVPLCLVLMDLMSSKLSEFQMLMMGLDKAFYALQTKYLQGWICRVETWLLWKEYTRYLRVSGLNTITNLSMKYTTSRLQFSCS